jgi:hypothetical protein
MWWITLVAWVVLSPLVALLIGTAIRLAAAASSPAGVELADEAPCPPERESHPERALAGAAQG